MSKTELGARKDAKWFAIGIEPSITKTPIGPIQVPVPYQVISDLSTATGTSANVRFNGNPAYLLDQSKQPKCTGDEQGSSGGSRSGTTSLEVKPTKGSGSVKINGKAIMRMGDMCTLNKENCRGKYVTMPASTPKEDIPKNQHVRVTIQPIQPSACPYHPLEITAIGTPPGGTLEWSHSGSGTLVDSSGRRITKGQSINLWNPYSDGSSGKSKKRMAKLSVTYTHPNGVAKHAKKIPIAPDRYEVTNTTPVHPVVSERLDPESLSGTSLLESAGSVVGALLGGVSSLGDIQDSYTFTKQKYALVVIPGMRNTMENARDMQNRLNSRFGISKSALIPNYTHGHGAKDVLETGGYEFNPIEIDKVAMFAAKSIREGLKVRGTVYVVAHSQGSAVFALAMEYLKLEMFSPKDIAKIHYQGFGPETYISKFRYGLGSARNVRNKGDHVPLLGDGAKWASGIAKTLIDPVDGLESLGYLGLEHWEIIDSDVPLPPNFLCLPVRHNFIANYLSYVKIPSYPGAVPDICPGRENSTPDKSDEEPDLREEYFRKMIYGNGSDGFGVI